MKPLYSLALVAVLTGCAAGGVDTRMNSVPMSTVTVDGYPVYVKILSLKSPEDTFDIETGEARVIAFTGLNEPLAMQARFRQAAQMELKRRFGDGAQLTELSAYAPTGIHKLFLRYSVRPEK